MAEAKMMQGDRREERNWFKDAVDLAPDLADVYKLYADALNQQGHSREASHYYQEAAKRETKDIQVLFTLEKRLRALKETKLAKGVNEQFQELTLANAKIGKMTFLYMSKRGKIARKKI